MALSEYGPCTETPICSICTQTSPPRCLQCSDPHYYLDLSTYSCSPDCNSSQPTNSSGFTYCRNNNYYVDPTSQSEIELGTIEYPYKQIITPFREILNYQNMSQVGVSRVINIRGQTQNQIITVSDLLVIVNQFNLTVQTYNVNNESGRAIIVGTDVNVTLPFPNASTSYFPTQNVLQSYQYQRYIDAGLYSAASIPSIYTKIIILASNATFDNIQFQTYLTSSLSFNFMENVGYTNLMIQNCKLSNWDNYFYYTGDASGLIVRNTSVTLLSQSRGFGMGNSALDLTCGCSKCKQYMTFDNNYIVFVGPVPSTQTIIFYSGFGELLVRNNYFQSVTFPVVTKSQIAYINSIKNCLDPQKYLFLIENNTFNSSLVSNGQFSIVAQTLDTVNHTNETFNIVIRKNQFLNMITQKTIFPLVVSFKCKLLFEENSFLNTSVNVPSQFFLTMLSLNASVLFVNNLFRNSVMDQGFKLQVNDSTFTNNSFQNISYSSSQKSSGLIQILLSKQVTIQNFSLSNTFLINSNMILIQSTNSVTLTSVTLYNVTSNSRDIILLDNYQFCSLSQISVTQLNQIGSTNSFLSLSNIPTNSTFSMKNSSMDQSLSPFLSVNSIVVSGVNQSVKFFLDGIRIYDSNTTSSTGFINFGSINYEKLYFNLTNLEVHNTFSLNSFLVSSMNGYINITSSRITQSTGQFALLQPFQSLSPPINVLFVQNFTMIGNYGSEGSLFVSQTNSMIYVNDSIFIRNFGTGRGSVAIADRKQSSIFIFNCTFTANYGILGGVLYAHIESKIICEQSHFESNFAYIGGVAYINDQGQINLKNSSFTNNSALMGNILYIINSEKESTLESLNMSSNNFNVSKSRQEFVNQIQSNFSGLFSYFSPDFIKKIQTQQQLSLIVNQDDFSVCLMRAELSVSERMTFTNEKSFIQAQAGASLSIENFLVEDSKLNCIVESSFSNVTITRMSAKNVTSGALTSKSLLSIYVGSYFEMSESSFSLVQMPLLNIIQSQVKINTVTLEELTINQNYVQLDSVTGEMNEITLRNATTSASSFFEINSCSITMRSLQVKDILGRFIIATWSSIVFEEANFMNNSLTHAFTLKGGSFMLSSYSQVTIKDSSFLNNTAASLQGGVIFAEGQLNNIPFLITNSTFKSNNALDGGSVFISDSSMTIQESYFHENLAEKNGGAHSIQCPSLSLSSCKTVISSTEFINNSALIQGGAISYDFISPIIDQSSIFMSNRASYGNDEASYPIKVRLEVFPLSFKSGELVTPGELIFSLLDQNDEVVLNQDLVAKIYLNSNSASVVGQTTFVSTNGVFNLSNFALVGIPGSTELLYLAVPEFTNQKYQLIFDELLTYYQFNFTFSKCAPGEILKDFKCIPCLPSKYSFFSGKSLCSNCPQNAICPGGNKLVVNSGYWRANTTTDYIVQCLVSDACPGGENLTCSYGYQGLLCEQCIGQTSNGYYARSQNGGCAKCNEYWIEYLKLAAIFIVLLIYIFGMVAMIVRNPSRHKDSSVLVRILTNYLQIVELVSELRLNWPDNIQSFLSKLSIFSSSVSKIFNIGCLVQTSFSNNISFYMIQQITLGLMPIAFLVFACIIWKIASIIMPNRVGKHFKRDIYPTVFVFMFLIYPTLVQKSLQMIQCVDIDGVYYLKNDLTVVCWSSSHQLIVLAVGLPIFLIWVVGFPVTIMVILTKHRKRFDEQDFIIKYGIFYIGLRDQTFYWEVLVINFRKIVCSVLAMCMTKENSYKLVITFVLIMILNQQLNKHLSPYNNKMLNTIESNSMFVGILVILNGTLFLHPTQANEDNIQLGIFIVIIVLNVLFLIHWLILICIILGKSVKRSLLQEDKKDEVQVQEMSEEEKDKIYQEMLGIERNPKLKIESAEKEFGEIIQSIQEQQTANALISQKTRVTLFKNSTFFPLATLQNQRNLDLKGFEESKEEIKFDDFESEKKRKTKIRRSKKNKYPAESIESNDEL